MAGLGCRVKATNWVSHYSIIVIEMRLFSLETSKFCSMQTGKNAPHKRQQTVVGLISNTKFED